MRPLSRRQMLTATGCAIGGGLLAVHGTQGQADEKKAEATQATGTEPKPLFTNSEQLAHYTPISPKKAADVAYKTFAEGLCMYAVVRSVVSLVAEQKQAEISPMFYNLFKYGHGGCGGWGSLCGTCNGAGAVMGLFCQDKKTCDKMSAELFRWYEATVLPEYVPAESTETNFPTSVSGSILCHLSTSQWCRVAKVDVFSSKQKERCKRLAADVAKKTVEILNAQYAADKESMKGKKEDQPQTAKHHRKEPPESCIACHSNPGGKPGSYKAEAPKTVTKMNCSKCHYMPAGHPESKGPALFSE